MKQKRERLELIHDILKAIQNHRGEMKPTHIMYKANLSPKMLNTYLDYLVKKGFIIFSESEKGKTYRILDKGHNYIVKYGMISSFIDSFGLD